MAVALPVFGENEAVTGAKTLDAGDSGVIQNVTATATVTLPSTALGLSYIIRNAGDGSVTVTVSPAAADKITGNGFTAADNKDAINTLGKGGDFIHLLGDGVDGWTVVAVSGTWTREA